LTIQKLKKSEEFRYVFTVGTKKEGKYFVLYMAPKEQAGNRVGFIVKKNVGNAVQRNRIKRILREICWNRCNHLLSSYDIVIMARKKIMNARFKEIEIEFERLIQG
jgi:ribonuclease P protein component